MDNSSNRNILDPAMENFPADFAAFHSQNQFTPDALQALEPINTSPSGSESQIQSNSPALGSLTNSNIAGINVIESNSPVQQQSSLEVTAESPGINWTLVLVFILFLASLAAATYFIVKYFFL